MVGIYGYMLGGLGYAVFGSSRHLAVGPTVGDLAAHRRQHRADGRAGDPVRFAQIAALVALLVAVLAAVAWALHLSTLTSFVSDTILVGFKAGAGISIAVTQTPSALGIAGRWRSLLRAARARSPARSARRTPSCSRRRRSRSCCCCSGDRLLPGRPVALGVVALSIVATGAARSDRSTA